MTKKEWFRLIGKKCPKCNGEGFIRDYDGTWLRDCECVKDERQK
jgi:hypothetical protein